MTSSSNRSAVNARLLVVEDDANLREALVDTLQLEGFEVSEAENAEKALEILERDSSIDLLISDVNMGKMSGHDLLQFVRQNYGHIPVLLVTAYASISESVSAMRNGAVDYLVKPFEAKLLLETVNKFIGHQSKNTDEPIAVSDSSQQLLQLARRVAQSESTVLVVGESGTGKEVLAKYIHNQSPRKDKPFIAINCAAIPENMLEAMLFGHEKGAYTGAYQSSPGKFEQANGGTLLLDEISEMDMGLQAKLLRVLQEREVERLGGRKNIVLDVRVIATSNRDMRQQVAEGKFREDLYFRLSVLPLQWAPLRDRVEDIIPLAESLLHRHATKQRRLGVELSPQARSTLQTYAWPGNVRELDNVMQRALILQAGAVISEQDLGLVNDYQSSEKPSLMDAVMQHTRDTISAIPAHLASSVEQKEEPDTSMRLGKDLMQREFEIILQTLKQERGSKKNTAAKLGISPRTLRYKLAKFREEGFNVEALACY
ncbi:two-component system, response regulator FlrC [Alteromonadaceae bacterium Bs31]|nr:two-component system, response regulator FlrC [Alteromonadaceae bacterium Bs31]